MLIQLIGSGGMDTEKFIELIKLISNKYANHTEVEYFLDGHEIEIRLYGDTIENGRKVEKEILEHFNEYIQETSVRKSSESELICFDCEEFIGIILKLNLKIPKLFIGKSLVCDGWFDEKYITTHYGESLDYKIFEAYGRMYGAKEKAHELEELRNYYNKIKHN